MAWKLIKDGGSQPRLHIGITWGTFKNQRCLVPTLEQLNHICGDTSIFKKLSWYFNVKAEFGAIDQLVNLKIWNASESPGGLLKPSGPADLGTTNSVKLPLHRCYMLG